MEKEIVISKIFKKENENSIRICSNIKYDQGNYELWFEIEKEYEKYVCVEKEDAFLIAILPYAIKKEMNIKIEGKISSRLSYQLNTYLIPMLCTQFNKRVIKLDSELDSSIYNNEYAVGTGISCGIDSLYTIQNHVNRKEKEYNVTHLTFFNAGASGKYGGDLSRQLYKNRMKFARKFAEDNCFKFISIDTNMNEFLMMDHEKTHTFRSLSCALLLQKLFSKYYYSSGFEFNETRIDEYDTACYDILNMQCLSTEDITFYSTGIETNRIGKVKKIVNYEPSYKNLNVCINEDYNCGECEKCKRTLLELDSIGKLELYKNVFDIDKFYKNKNKNLLFMLHKVKEKNNYYIESYNEYKKRNIKIPFILKVISCIPTKNQVKKIIFKIISKEKVKKILGKQTKINDGWLD